jgi:hypothetical protein
MSQLSTDSIDNLKNFIASQGIQESSRYAVTICGIDFSEQVIAVDLPGPKYDFLNINYWQGNPFFKLPMGVKFEDSLVIQMLVPEIANGELFNFLKTYTGTQFTTNNGGWFFDNTKDSRNLAFSWNRPDQGAGCNISIAALSRGGDIIRQYFYRNCFLEKILPLRFEAGTTEPQSITMSFVVSAMGLP